MEHMEHIFHSHMAVTCFLVHDGRPNTLHFVFSFSIFSTAGHFMSIRIFMFTYMHIYCLWQANCVAFNAVCCLSLFHFFYCLALLLLSLFVSSFFLFLFFFVRFLFLFFLSFCDFKSNFKRFASASPEHCIERDTKESNCFGTPKRIVFRKSWSSRLSCVSLANALPRDRCVVRAGVLGVHVTSEAHQDLANPGCSEVLQECWHHHRRCNYGQLSESAG